MTDLEKAARIAETNSVAANKAAARAAKAVDAARAAELDAQIDETSSIVAAKAAAKATLKTILAINAAQAAQAKAHKLDMVACAAWEAVRNERATLT